MKRILHLIFRANNFSYVIVSILLSVMIASSAHSQVKGVVYIDYDLNGRRTATNPNEPGVEGVKVHLFVGNNPTPFVATTNDLGEYSFDESQIPVDSLARVEFSNFPETFSPSMIGLQNATDVQFIKAPALSVNLGIANDDEFCQGVKDLRVTTACYVMGDPLAGGSAGDDPALILFNHKASGLAGVDDFSMVKLATAAQIGSTWIASFQRDSRRMLVGAIVRRHVGLGPLGTGGFYYIDLANGNSVNEFIDVKTIGIDTGPDPHIDPITGLSTLPASKTARSRDSLSFHVAGKVGMGGVQLTRYQDTLYMVNLYDKKLYSFKIGKPFNAPQSPAEANVRSYTIPHPNCSNGDFAPWALKYYRNKMYLGIVCTAETSQKQSDLKGAIYEFNPKTAQFKNIFEFPLGYKRDPLDGTQGCDTIDSWKPWSGIFPKQCNYPLGSPDPLSAFLVNPQPIISDIEFDDDGSMFIGMLDRGGLQTGQNQPGIAVDDTLNYYGFMSGDLLRAQRNLDGTYTMESNGVSGPYVADGPSGPGVKSAHDKDAGPGGGEFFFEDYWINGQGSVGHAELTNGGIFKLPGDDEIFTSAFDPLHQVYLATGFLVFDTKTGKRKRGYAVYSIREGSLGKSGGVGDLTAACEPAPLSIGNRIWFDANRDGIQDPNEPGVDGQILTLHDMENGGVEVGRDTTANGGQFYFSDFNVVGGLKREHQYEIRQSTRQTLGAGSANIVDIAQSAGIKTANQRVSGNIPINANVATANASDNTVANLLRLAPVDNSTPESNLHNSDAAYNPDSSAAIVTFKTGNNSENNYTFDIGWMLNLPKASMGDYAWYDLNRNGIQDLRKDPFGNIVGPELPAKGVIMELYNSTDQLIKTDTTDVTGAYRMNDIEPGQYYVKFNPISYPASDFVVADLNKGTNDSLDNDIERAVYKSSTFTLAPGQHDPRWDIGFFRTTSPEISDPCACDSTILYLPGDDIYTKYVYREKVTIKATPGGKWAIIPLDAKKNVYTYGLYEDDGEGYIDSIDLSKKQYFFTEVPDSLGVYEFKFAHKSQDGYALAATDGVDTLSIGAICYEVKEQYDTRLDGLCANGDKIQLQRDFPNGKATYYFIADSAFVFRDGFNEFTLIDEAVARGPITEFDPKLYKPNSTVSLYMKWEPFGVADKKGACQKSMILNVKINTSGACIGSLGDYAWYDLNRNGIQDLRKDPFGTVLGPELPTKGVIMEVYSPNNTFVKSDTTGVDGKYHIGNIETGQYYVKFNPVSYPATDFVVTDMNKGTNDSLDSDIERGVYKSTTFMLPPGTHDPRWDIGFFRTPSPEISDPCACDSTILYLPGDDIYTKYVYREKVTIKATPGGKWAIIPFDAKKNLYSYGLYEDDGEGYIDSIDLSKKRYYFTEVPDSLGLYEFKFSHKSHDGYALVATDGVDTLSIGAICYEVKEQYDMRLDTLCANGDKIQLQRNFPNGTATYYFIADSAFVFRDGFNEFTLIEAAVARGAITEVDPKLYKPNSTISLYMKWLPNGAPDKKGACQKSMILNIKISNTGPCTPTKDLELSKTLVGDCRREVGNTVQFKVVVTNKSANTTPAADSVYVQDYLPANFTFVSATSTRGAFNQQTMKWGPLKLASGQSDTLTISVKINNKGGFIGGSICNEAEIVSMVGLDSDSQPGNKVIAEDDYGIACVSVPLKICPERRDTVIISAPAGYQTYQWFRNGTKIVGATSQTLEVGEVGSYTVEVSNGQCPTKNCCPAIVEAECICPEDICIPVIIKQTKSKYKPIVPPK